MIIEILTPVHIGAGEDISPIEYIIDDKFYRIDMDALFKAPSFDRDKFIKETTKGSIYLGDINKDLAKKYPLYILDIENEAKKYLEQKKSNIKEFIKSANRVYLPGSAIKGSILSALYWYILKEEAKKDENIKTIIISCLTGNPSPLFKLPNFYQKFLIKKWDEKLRKEIFVFQEIMINLAFYYLIKEETREFYTSGKIKFADWLEVSDTNSIEPNDCINIILSEVAGSKRKINILFESLKIGSKFNFRLKKQKIMFDEEKILEIVDEFYSKVLEKDKRWTKLNNLSIDFANIENKKYKLKIGQAVSSLATSFLILAEEFNIEKEYINKWRFTKYKTEPKTRKIVNLGDNNWNSLGWVKLTTK